MNRRDKVQTQAERLALARRIRAAGVQVYIHEDDGAENVLPDDLIVYQCGGATESRAFDFAGGTAVALQVTITNNVAGLAIASFTLELPWTKNVVWLPDPSEHDGDSTVYRFETEPVLEFSREDVLNHRADLRHTFARGESAIGSLIGTAGEPIPEEVRHGNMVPAFLTVNDQFWRSYRFAVKLWADRSEKRVVNSKRSSIFEFPDAPIHHRS